MTRPVEIAPSILAADFSRLSEDVRKVEKEAGRIHVDVMDGHFVPNLSMGPATVASLRPHVTKPIEVHLMVEQPAMFVEPFVDGGADRIVFHTEVSDASLDLVAAIHKAGARAGVAIKPATPWEAAEEYLDEIDLVIVMTVEPGFGGQSFLDDMLPKVTQGADSIKKRSLAVDLEVDGGIDTMTGPKARRAGANIFVAGSSIFGGSDPGDAARNLVAAVSAS